MIYFLDTEFNGFGGALLSMGIVRQDGASLYLVIEPPAAIEPWVAENVMPIMRSVPDHITPQRATIEEVPVFLSCFFGGDPAPHIVTDWPDDVRYFCSSVITGPGQMIALPSIQFSVMRVDAYPTALEGAVQHNAWWDAMALRAALTP